ncbi:hypothetical protein [Stenoxybacter acetivorans]|uniref:hypothetical protein n=1 Tax=Stenoxybacter acetivorans TaxID=422441 RepID=UPI0005699A8E|nr:hypothetical protein [Stenoxybacter acetivorans]
MPYKHIVTEMMKIDGAVLASIVDYETGMVVAGESQSNLDIDFATAGAASIVNAQSKSLTLLDIKAEIDDILVTLDDQYHITRVLRKSSDTAGHPLFLYLVLQRNSSPLALARRILQNLDAQYQSTLA